MLTQPLIEQLHELRLRGMAAALEQQGATPDRSALSFEERFTLLVDREIAWRDSRRLERLLRAAKLKHGNARSRSGKRTFRILRNWLVRIFWYPRYCGVGGVDHGRNHAVHSGSAFAWTRPQ